MSSKVRVPPQPLQLSRRSRRTSYSSEDSALDTPESSPTVETILGLPMLGSIRGGILTPGPSSPSSPTFTPTGSTTNLNVKFAPLPELAPRRRKSSTALGVASRGQMVRRRRLNSETGRQPYELDDEPPVLAPHPPRPKVRKVKSANSTPTSTPPDMQTFKKLWKKMALSTGRKDSISSLSSTSSTPSVVRGSPGDIFPRSSSSSSLNSHSESTRRVGGAWEDPVASAYSRPPPIIAEHVGLQKLKWIEKTEKEQEQIRECFSSNSTVSSDESSASYGVQQVIRI